MNRDKWGRLEKIQRGKLMDTNKYVPVTPGGTMCLWLISSTEKEAWKKLLINAAHMPYRTKENFQKRGYTVEALNEE